VATTPVATTPVNNPRTDWREHWFENEEAIYLNLAGPLPAAAAGAFRGLSAHAEFLTCLALAGLAACGGVLAGARAWSQERPRAAARPRPRPLAQARPEAVGPAER